MNIILSWYLLILCIRSFINSAKLEKQTACNISNDSPIPTFSTWPQDLTKSLYTQPPSRHFPIITLVLRIYYSFREKFILCLISRVRRVKLLRNFSRTTSAVKPINLCLVLTWVTVWHSPGQHGIVLTESQRILPGADKDFPISLIRDFPQSMEIDVSNVADKGPVYNVWTGVFPPMKWCHDAFL